MSRVIFAAVTLLAVASSVWAAEPNGDDEAARAFSKIVAVGPGVHAIKKDDTGRVTSFVIVGQSRISTVLGKAKGLEVARQRAQLAVKAEFVKWLKEKATVFTGTNDEAIVVVEGSREGEQRTSKEAGKAVEKTQSRMEAVAEGMMRGVELLHTEVSQDDQTYTVVMGWEEKTALAAEGVEKANRGESGTPTGNGKADPQKPAAGDDIRDRKATSPGAKKYLPN